MFRTDDAVVKQKIADLHSEAKSRHLKQQFRHKENRPIRPFWIVLLTSIGMR
ncbi:hypothetical protein [Planomicrobium sp. YIM 101495]|uniref:hypothetical protein n=1 Tax=Planomicrobium sp. YIM 101495 TaxID=2665160 RepID=UPI0012B7D422|nr:hypothetical protein [Planomicrobium sp. YIM 101495]MTD30673.1 hypothetical protein [Planomicrobium sp. YIM 101495]